MSHSKLAKTYENGARGSHYLFTQPEAATAVLLDT